MPATLAITNPATSADEPAQRLTASDKSGQHNHHHHSENRGLKVFRSEMMQAFAMQFRSISEQAGSDAYSAQASASQTAGEILSMAKLVLSGNSQSRAATLIQSRQSMTQAVSISHESAAGADDVADVDAAAQSIDQGLVDMETEEGLVTTASLTTIDTVSRQRTCRSRGRRGRSCSSATQASG